MNWEFHTRDGIKAFVAENGMDALRDMVDSKRLAGERREFAAAVLSDLEREQRAEVDARRAAEERTIALRAALASEAQAVEAKRSADAAEVSAKAAEVSATAAVAYACHAKMAWIIAVIAAVIAAIALFIK